MIPITAYAGRSIAVFGLGRSGASAARALAAGDAEVLVWDDDPARRAALEGERIRAAEPSRRTWSDVEAVVLSPGVPLTHPRPHPVVGLAAELGAEVLGDVELFARTRPAGAIVSITGTNGKSTTTALIGHLLAATGRSVQVGGNLGTPVLDFEPLAANGVYVLEMSSYQVDLTRSLRSKVVVLLNITADHLDRHGSMDGYIAAKRRLLEMAPPDAALVIGIDDAPCAGIAADMRAAGRRVVEVTVGRVPAVGYAAVDGTIFRDGKQVADLGGIDSLRGAHNWQNAACAFAAVAAMGVPDAAIAEALSGFPGLAHRMEPIATIDGVAFVNDSKATNAEAAAKALASYDRIYWIAGGLAKAGGIETLRPLFGRIKKAFLIGEAADTFAATLADDVDHELCGDLETAVGAAHAAGRGDRGSVVLLSPACASFDQFPNFEARGDAFRSLVAALANVDAERQRAGGAG